MGHAGEGQSQGFSGPDELTHPKATHPRFLAWIQATQLLRGAWGKAGGQRWPLERPTLVKIIMRPLVVFQEVGGATLSGNSDSSAP